MSTLPAPPQDQSTAMNAATPSIQDFVDRTRLVERRLRTSDTMRCPACGQALPKPTGGYRAAIRCGDHQRSGVTPALPVTITGWYSSAGIVGAWTTSGAVQCGVVPNAAECRAFTSALQSGTTTTEDMDRIQRCLGCGWAIQQQAKRAKPGYHRRCSELIKAAT